MVPLLITMMSQAYQRLNPHYMQPDTISNPQPSKEQITPECSDNESYLCEKEGDGNNSS
jgi:hypothetical protein